ncbi:MAG: hypothetical protein RR324_01110 [Cellulosilyticaceae bacterium]
MLKARHAVHKKDVYKFYTLKLEDIEEISTTFNLPVTCNEGVWTINKMPFEFGNLILVTESSVAIITEDIYNQNYQPVMH